MSARMGKNFACKDIRSDTTGPQRTLEVEEQVRTAGRDVLPRPLLEQVLQERQQQWQLRKWRFAPWTKTNEDLISERAR
jgi:hypothetical protein